MLRNIVGIVCRRYWRDLWQHKTLLPLRYHYVANVRFQSNMPNEKLIWNIFLVDVNLTNVVLLHDVLEGRVCVVDGRWRNNVGCLIMHQLNCGTWSWRLTVMARFNVEVRNWNLDGSFGFFDNNFDDWGATNAAIFIARVRVLVCETFVLFTLLFIRLFSLPWLASFFWLEDW